jgi:hypothetical protein
MRSPSFPVEAESQHLYMRGAMIVDVGFEPLAFQNRRSSSALMGSKFNFRDGDAFSNFS